MKVYSCNSANILVVTACASYEQKQKKMATINCNRMYGQVGIPCSTVARKYNVHCYSTKFSNLSFQNFHVIVVRYF